MRRRFAFSMVATLTLACWTSTPTTAHAWGHHYGGYGWGGYGGYGWGGYGGYGWGGYGGWGGYRGWGWGYPYYGSYGGYGGYGWGYPSYFGSSYYSPGYYSTPYYYSYAPSVAYSAPMYVASGPVTSYQSFYPTTATSQTPPPNRAYIQVDVPPNAELSFDGKQMQQTGPVRQFQTPPLAPQAGGYIYDVTARWMENGKEQHASRTVHVRPGQRTEVNLTRPNETTPASTPVRRPDESR
jgi:uncharacterized protein (TIGR03000 family)